MKEAINRSLESVVLAARRRHADRLQDVRGLDLDDPQVMSGAGRGSDVNRADSHDGGHALGIADGRSGVSRGRLAS